MPPLDMVPLQILSKLKLGPSNNSLISHVNKSIKKKFKCSMVVNLMMGPIPWGIQTIF